jgi:hypothetical protein
MTEQELEAKLFKAQIAVLSAASPDDWHIVADVWNWDEPLKVLYWIVSQTNCDRATAQMLFWKGEATAYAWQDCDEVMGDDEYSVEPMLSHIVRRFNTDGFPRNKLEFDIFQAKTGSYVDNDKDWADYWAAIKKGVKVDFADIAHNADQADDPLAIVPPALMVTHSPGRRVSKISGDHCIFERFPLGVNYDTGEFVYDA